MNILSSIVILFKISVFGSLHLWTTFSGNEDNSRTISADQNCTRPVIVSSEMPEKAVAECVLNLHQLSLIEDHSRLFFKTQLGDNECPQTIKADLLTSGIECRFAYKRCDIKFVWPFAEKPA